MLGVANAAERETHPGLQALIKLDEDMVAQGTTNPEGDEESITLSVNANPSEVEDRVDDSPLGRIMLRTGDSLLRPYEDPEEKTRDLVIGEVLPTAVVIAASKRSWTSGPPFIASSELVDYVSRWVAVGLWYGEQTDEQKGVAVQYLGTRIDFNTYYGQTDITMGRLVVASDRLASDRFYSGHNAKTRYINDRRALKIARAIRELL